MSLLYSCFFTMFLVLYYILSSSFCDQNIFPFKMMNCIVSYLLFSGPQIVLFIELVSSLCDIYWSTGWLGNITRGGYLIHVE